MTKAVPRSDKGEGFDVREAAREAARRSGLSLGDWLSGVIADQAAQMGVAVEALNPERQLGAVSARLARLSGRTGEQGTRHRRGDKASRPPVERGAPEDVANEDAASVRRSRRQGARSQSLEASYGKTPEPDERDDGVDADTLLDDAARAMDRQTKRNAEQTRDALDKMGSRLADLERRMTSRPLENVDPVRRALAKLEERLEDFGRADPDERLDDMLRQFEKKLSDLERHVEPERKSALSRTTSDLDRLEARLEELASRAALPGQTASPRLERIEAKLEAKLESSGDARPAPASNASDSGPSRALRAGLERAVADIARRQQALEAESASRADAPPRSNDAARYSSPPESDIVDQRGEHDAVAARIGTARKGSSEPSHNHEPFQNQTKRGEANSLMAAVSERLEAPTESLGGGLRRDARDSAHADALEGVQREISAIGAKLDSLPTAGMDPDVVRQILGQAQDIRDLLAAVLQRPASLDKVEGQLIELGHRLDKLGEVATDRGDLSEVVSGMREVRAVVARSSSDDLMRTIDARFASLSRKLEESTQKVEARAQSETTVIKSFMRDIDVKLDRRATAGPEAGRLEAILNDVAKKLEAPRSYLASDAVETAMRDLEAKLEQMAERSSVDADALHQAVYEITATLSQSSAPSALDVQNLETLVRDIQTKLAQPSTMAGDLRRVEELVGALSQKIDAMAWRSTEPMEIATTLADQVSRLAERIDELRQPQADPAALDGLREQIQELSSRLADSDAGLRAFAQMEQSLDGLFSSLSDTHQSAVEAACAAARDVAAEMLGPAAAPKLGALDQDLVNLREAQNISERRVHQTLAVVHDTLEKVVDRLASVERDVASVAADPVVIPAPAQTSLASGPAPVFAAPQREIAKAVEEPSAGDRKRGEAPEALPVVGTPPVAAEEEDVLIEPGSGFAPGRRLNPAAQPAEPRSEQSTFIAAARRAIRLNGGDAGAKSQTAAGLRDLDEAKARARAAAARLEATEFVMPESSLASRLRRYVDRRKRPILYALAAVVLAICSLQLVSALLNKAAAPTQSKTSGAPPDASGAAPDSDQKHAAPGRSGALDRSSTVRLAQAKNQDESQAVAASTAALSPTSVLPTSSIPTFAASSLQPPEITSLRTAASRGDSGAQYQLAVRYADGRGVTQNPVLAAQWFMKAARQDVPAAEYRLGVMYEKGFGVARDFKTALDWYHKAADAGHVRAMHNLAVLSAQTGENGGPDYATAAAWFQKAAEFGVRDSQYNLAILYARGLGVGRSLEQAYVWFDIAAAQGDTDAAKKRDEVAARLDPGQIVDAKAAAAAFHPRAEVKTANEPPAAATLGVAARGDAAPRKATPSGV